MNSSTGGSGTIDAPYTGISGYTTSETTTTEVTVQKPVTVEKDGIEYAIYSYTSSAETVYVAVLMMRAESRNTMPRR